MAASIALIVLVPIKEQTCLLDQAMTSGSDEDGYKVKNTLIKLHKSTFYVELISEDSVKKIILNTENGELDKDEDVANFLNVFLKTNVTKLQKKLSSSPKVHSTHQKRVPSSS